MNAIDLLIQDHRDVDELFRRFQIADKPETKDEIAKQIVHDLSVHAAIEEQFFYPVVRFQLDDGSGLADHSIEEHAEVKELLTTVEKNEAGSAEHEQAMMEIIESVRHHVEDEEQDMFPPLRNEMEADSLERLGTVMETAKQAVPTHPHPLVPGTATAQLVAGPWATIVDKVRDLVSR